MGVGGQHHALAALPTGKDPVPIVQEAGWASEPVWIGAENLAPTGIWSPNLPARSESLYQLHYLSSCILHVFFYKVKFIWFHVHNRHAHIQAFKFLEQNIF